jgi:hypothetical protein
VSAGEIGDVVHVDAVQGYDLDGPFGRLLRHDPSHWVHRLPGGLFQNVMSHAVARILDLMPGSAPNVEARWFGRDDEPFPSELRVMLFGQRVTGTLTFTSAARPARRTARILGTRCALDVDLDARSLTVDRATSLPGAFAKVELTWQRFVEASRNLSRNVTRLRRADLHYFEGMHTLFARFYASIETGAPAPVSHAEAIRVTRVMEAIFDACGAAVSDQPLTRKAIAQERPQGQGQDAPAAPPSDSPSNRGSAAARPSLVGGGSAGEAAAHEARHKAAHEATVHETAAHGAAARATAAREAATANGQIRREVMA